METIGERIKRLREQAGLSQRDLSEPGVSYAYISRVEHNQRDPSEKALRKLASKLGVTAHYLETGAQWPCPHCEIPDPGLAVWFSPGAIVDAFDGDDDDDPLKVFVQGASQETLRQIGENCIASDPLWRMFHDLIEAEVEAAM